MLCKPDQTGLELCIWLSVSLSCEFALGAREESGIIVWSRSTDVEL